MEHSITGRELIEYISEKDLMVELTEDEANLVVASIVNDGYSVAVEDKELFLVSVDQNGKHKEPATLESIVDFASEINYLKIKELKGIVATGKMVDYNEYCTILNSIVIMYDEKIKLHNVFERVCHAEMEKINKIIKNAKENVVNEKQPYVR